MTDSDAVDAILDHPAIGAAWEMKREGTSALVEVERHPSATPSELVDALNELRCVETVRRKPGTEIAECIVNVNAAVRP